MTGGGIIALIVVYLVGVIVSAYLFGAADESEAAPLAVFWPLLALVGIVFGPLYLIARWAERR